MAGPCHNTKPYTASRLTAVCVGECYSSQDTIHTIGYSCGRFSPCCEIS